MRIKRKNAGDGIVLEVEGALTVSEIVGLKKAVQENLRKGDRLELDVSLVSEADLTFIQILAAAAKRAEKGDRSFTVRSPVPEPVMRTLRLSGVLNHARCRKGDCVWCRLIDQTPGA